jgi:hypothetical protein
MARLGETTVEGLPADLVIRQARLGVLELLGRREERREEAAALLDKLHQNPWRLTRGVYEFYLEEALRVLGPDGEPPADAPALAGTIASLYQDLAAEPGGNGRRLLRQDRLTTLALWRSAGETTVALILGPPWIEAQWSDPLSASFARQGAEIGLTDLPSARDGAAGLGNRLAVEPARGYHER